MYECIIEYINNVETFSEVRYISKHVFLKDIIQLHVVVLNKLASQIAEICI